MPFAYGGEPRVWLRDRSGQPTQFDGDITVRLACGQSTYVSIITHGVGGPQDVHPNIQVPWSLDEPDEILVELTTDNPDDTELLDSARHVSGKYVEQKGWASQITVRRWNGFWGEQQRKALWVKPPQNGNEAPYTNCRGTLGTVSRICDFLVWIGTDGNYFNVRRQCDSSTPTDVTITATIVGETYGDQTTMFDLTANAAPYVTDPVIVPEPVVVGVGVPNNESAEDTDPNADLIADVRGYAAETDEGQAHVDRWMRVLAAFGDNNGHEPMTATEAKTYADRGWFRWDPVVTALTELEAAQTTEPEPAVCVSPELQSNVEDYHGETWQGEAHVTRWQRVLQTFAGIASGDTVMPSTEAQTYLDRGWTRWEPVVEALKCLERR